MRGLLCVVLMILGYANNLLAQSAETGLPFISNFTPKQYNANTQNWAAIQDQRGVMYFGNNKGVLEYDGVNWSLIPVKNHSIVRSLALDKEGVIYVGAVGEIGYLSTDLSGKQQYTSLKELLSEEDQKFSDVWTTLVKGDEVYFHTLHKLFRYKNGKFTSWNLASSYHRSFLVHNKVYLRQEGIGLMVLEADSLIKISGGELFSQHSVSAMLPIGDKVLIGSRNIGLHLYNPKLGTIEKLPWEANAFLEGNLLYHGLILDNGNLAFSTIRDGIIITDRKGNILSKVNQHSGLPFQTVYYLYSDKVGSLWLCLASGLSKVEVNSPISIFDKVAGLHGGILAVTRFEGTLYVCTHQGIFYLNETGNFVQVSGLASQSWQFENFNVPGQPGKQILLSATTEGVFEVNKKGVKLIFKGRTSVVKTSRSDPARIYLGLNGTMASMRYYKGGWLEEGAIKIIYDEVRSMHEDDKGTIWMGSMYAGVYSLKVKDWNNYLADKSFDILDKVKNYDTSKGLPTLNWNYFHRYGSGLLVTTQKGIYTYNDEKDAFEPEEKIMQAFPDAERWFYYVNEDQNGDLWYDSDKGKGMLIKNNYGYKLSENQFKRIIVSPENQVTGYTDTNGILWFGTPDGLFRFDSKFVKNYQQPFPILIRKVVLGEDSVIFNGTYQRTAIKGNTLPKLIASANQSAFLENALSYSNNSLTFHYAAPVFEQENSSMFSYFLEGYDNTWSAWSKESRKEYTNLPEGNYIFRVRAKNFYDTVSKEADYKFSVAPPLFRTPLAYAAYLFMFIGMITLIAKANASRLKKDNIRLEAIVQNRTAEINLQKEKIGLQKNEVEKSYQNLSTLSQIGQHITSSLDLDSIINTLYTSLGTMMEVDSFGVGIYNKQTNSIDFRHAKENGAELPPFSHSLLAEDKLAVWCFNNRKKILINDLHQEYGKYISTLNTAVGGKHAGSIIYFPIKIKKKIIGVITVQSYRTHAFESYHLDILRTLAAYTAIALDNSNAYLKLNEINSELSTTLQNLKQTQTQLVQSEKMASLGQLTAGVAHEINNPINFVSAGIDSLSVNWEELTELIEKYAALSPGEDNSQLLSEIELLKKQLDLPYLLDEIPQLLKGIKSGAQRTTEIVKSLRNFARLDEDSLKTTNLHEGLESTLVILRNKIGDRIQIKKDFDLQIPDICCFPGQLNQVFMNIINNAIQAIEGEGEITLKTCIEQQTVIVSISDTGKGMTEEICQRIFEPFFTTKEVGEGTGLGLSISYSIIEKHQGKLTVSSTPGLGTTFSIYLPLTTTCHGRS